MFYEKEVIDGFFADNHHCQSSMVGKAESYNEQFRSSDSTKFCREFVNKNMKTSDVFSEENEDGTEEDDDIVHTENSCEEFRKTFFWESNRKSLSSAIWHKLCIEEATDREILETEFFGPKLDSQGKRVTYKQTSSEFMDKIDGIR